MPSAKIREIQSLVGTLTYGDMMKLCDTLWQCRTEKEAALQKTEIPAMLHAWSIQRVGPAPDEPEEEPVEVESPKIAADQPREGEEPKFPAFIRERIAEDTRPFRRRRG